MAYRFTLICIQRWQKLLYNLQDGQLLACQWVFNSVYVMEKTSQNVRSYHLPCEGIRDLELQGSRPASTVVVEYDVQFDHQVVLNVD